MKSPRTRQRNAFVHVDGILNTVRLSGIPHQRPRNEWSFITKPRPLVVTLDTFRLLYSVQVPRVLHVENTLESRRPTRFEKPLSERRDGQGDME